MKYERKCTLETRKALLNLLSTRKFFEDQNQKIAEYILCALENVNISNIIIFYCNFAFKIQENNEN